MRILFVAPYIPSPIRVRPYQWIRSLARLGHRVRLVALQPPEDAWVDGLPVRDCCESATVFPLGRGRTLMNAALAIPQRVPLQAAYSLHPEAERFVASEAEHCDVVHIEHLRGALLGRRIGRMPTVIDAVDSIASLFEQTSTQAASWKHRLVARADLGRTRRFEGSFPRRFDRTIVSSSRDAAAFRQLAGSAHDRVVTLPNGVDLEYFRPSEQQRDPATVLFSGKMSYHANEAAALRLVHEIMPLVWRQRPDAKVVIAGKDPSATIRSLGADSRISITGYVDDLRPLFWQATLVAAPLVYGTGIQNKVLEAMACGVPVVASDKACEGIRAQAGRHLLVGRENADLARSILAALENPELRQRVASEGRQYVTSQHDWTEMARQLVRVYEEVQAVRQCA